MAKKALGYVSAGGKNRNYLIKKQKEQIQKYAAEHGIKLIGFVGDKEGKEESLLYLLSIPPDHNIDLVLVPRYSTISTDAIFALWIKKELLKKGISIQCVGKDEMDEGFGPLLKQIAAAFARFEKEYAESHLAEYRKRRAVLKGIKVSGNCPYGYAYQGDSIMGRNVVVVPEEAMVVKKIFDWYLELGSLQKVTDRLIAEGITTRRGKNFSRQAIHHILTNPFYIGQIVHNRYEYVTVPGRKRKKALLVEQSLAPAPHPPIIDEETFKKVQEKLAKQKRRKG